MLLTGKTEAAISRRQTTHIAIVPKSITSGGKPAGENKLIERGIRKEICKIVGHFEE